MTSNQGSQITTDHISDEVKHGIAFMRAQLDDDARGLE